MSAFPPTSDPLVAAESSRWFAEQVQPHHAALKDHIRHAFPTLRDVEDVAQESYLRIWRLRAAEPIRSARAFLFTVARRIAVDELRRRRRSPTTTVENFAGLNVAADEFAAPDAPGMDEKVELLIAAIDALPARCREVVILRKLRCVSQRETAERLGISEKGVENQLARGIERCRVFFRRRGVEYFFRDES